MEFAEVVRRRRMVRHFADEPVARPVLERIAAAAQRTPSAGFSQGQRLVVVTDPGAAARRGGGGRGGGVRRRGLRPVGSAAAPRSSSRASASRSTTTATASRTSSTTRETRSSRPTPYWWMDVGCTVMMVLLAAVDEGSPPASRAPTTSTGFARRPGIPADYHTGRRHPGRAAAARPSLAVAAPRLAAA